MPSIVFLNGRFMDEPGDARISAFDAGFQHGVGLFETMHATSDGGEITIFQLWGHIDRLVRSARELGLSDSLRAPALGEAIQQTAARADMPRMRIRLTVTGGDLNLLARARSDADGHSADPTVLIHAQPATEYPDALFDEGIMVTVADLRVNPLDPTEGHKTLNYWPRLHALQRAARANAGEALVFQVTNHLAGGCVSNALLIKDDQLITPIGRGEEEEVAGIGRASAEGHGPDGQPLESSPRPDGRAVMPSPVLPGVVRGWAMDQASELGLTVTRRTVSIDDVLGADELVLTNASWGAVPVVRVEQQVIGEGKPGAIARALRERWLAAI